MTRGGDPAPTAAPHNPVLLDEVMAALAPIDGGIFVDGTFGAGGYSRRLLEQGAAQVIAIDRDPQALATGWALVAEAGGRLVLVEGVFADLIKIAEAYADGPVSGVVLDIGVSSMQIDQADRGFSFMRDGPLDMRMAPAGPSASDLVNRADERGLADVIFHYGEDRAARRIARTIVAARVEAPITRTGQLTQIVTGCLPRQRPGQIHPATRTFQALRIAVNDELGQLVEALAAAESVLEPGGRLVIVTFHSLEDRIVKRYFRIASGQDGQGSRHGPARLSSPPRYCRPAKALQASAAEVGLNPRARSARLRAAVRTDAPPQRIETAQLGLPDMPALAELITGARR
ncbi:MAG TPA: 16S rRNA (cytosine(1402)-N(4))-methyltransferase RsmH [Thermohalobaculum sp.]|nr:16S rRNA (cytosine(1402)-N(4))-methyltransferase RsmH [Thermohalobaculum sp.]